MAKTIDFYFDFSSPYGYFAACRIDALAAKHGREVDWRPFLLGVVFKTTGGAPLPSIPLKGPYALRDMLRTAKFLGIDYRFPAVFPISSVAPTRAFYWLQGQDPQRARALAKALYRAYFVDGVDISKPEETISVCARLGLNAEDVRTGMNDPALKERTKGEVDRALAAGAFGSPYIVIDGEPFWGSDRFDQVDQWLATGGW
jgi:2-hydroxychromene-2-carboxylate isomerase